MSVNTLAKRDFVHKTMKINLSLSVVRRVQRLVEEDPTPQGPPTTEFAGQIKRRRTTFLWGQGEVSLIPSLTRQQLVQKFDVHFLHPPRKIVADVYGDVHWLSPVTEHRITT